MMKQNGNTSEQSERGLLPYVVIVAATKGDPEAMKMVVQHYEGYISYLSTRTLKDERGNTYYGIDEDIRDRLRSKLMRAVLDFEVLVNPCAYVSPFRRHTLKIPLFVP